MRFYNSKLNYVRNFFGLGFGFETYSVCDDAIKFRWKTLTVKVFIGPLVWNVNFVIGRKTPIAPSEHSVG